MKTSSVLTDEELALVAEQKRRLDLLASMDVHLKEPSEMLALVNRLVAKVERLEAVAKAAQFARELLVFDCVMPERHGPTVDREVAEAICDSCAAQSRAQLRVALAELGHPVQGPMIGWAPKPKESS